MCKYVCQLKHRALVKMDSAEGRLFLQDQRELNMKHYLQLLRQRMKSYHMFLHLGLSGIQNQILSPDDKLVNILRYNIVSVE